MKELSIERMEMVNGGSTCGLIVFAGVALASGVVATALLTPAIWASPKTWYAAASSAAGIVGGYKENCL
jgi:hypothetical protein